MENIPAWLWALLFPLAASLIALSRNTPMSISSALEGLFKKSESKVGDLLPDGSLFSNRMMVIVGFVVLVIAARSFMTEQVVSILGFLVGGYLLSGTVTKSVQLYWNGKIRLRELELAYVDGKLDDNEVALMGKSG